MIGSEDYPKFTDNDAAQLSLKIGQITLERHSSVKNVFHDIEIKRPRTNSMIPQKKTESLMSL